MPAYLTMWISSSKSDIDEILARVRRARPRGVAARRSGMCRGHTAASAPSMCTGSPTHCAYRKRTSIGVIGFYTLFHEAPTGRRIIRVCTDPSCALADADQVSCMTCLRATRDTAPDQTTADGEYTVEHSPCLGMCDLCAGRAALARAASPIWRCQTLRRSTRSAGRLGRANTS